MKYHRTKDGRKIKIRDLEICHLRNIIKWIKSKSKEGITISHGGGTTADDMWYYEEQVTGKRVKKYFNYKHYKKELKRRTKI